MSITAILVTRRIDKRVGFLKEACKKGSSVEAQKLVTKTVMKYLTYWTPKLNDKERCEVKDYIKKEYAVVVNQGGNNESD